MKARNTGLKIIYIAFLGIICASWILWIFLSQFIRVENNENRNLRTAPGIASVADYQKFPEWFEEFLNDHMPFRNQLIALNRMTDYYVFGNIQHEEVAIGKDGWLFYCSEADGNPRACYQGTNLLTDVRLKEYAENLLKQRDYLAEQGIEFVIFIAPNKERIYPEYMPEKYGQPADMYKALQIVNYLRENTDLRIVYPYEELMAAKELFPEEIYYKTDTHWNEIGGYIGSKALLKELGIELPDLTEITVKPKGEGMGDLARELGLGFLLKRTDYTVEGYDDHHAESVGEYEDIYEYRAVNADPRKLYAVRDSFFINMLPYVQSQFNESHTKFGTAYLYDDFAGQKPDVFVYECVERYIDRLSSFNVQYGRQDGN